MSELRRRPSLRQQRCGPTRHAIPCSLQRRVERMAFILTADSRHEDVTAAFCNYREYLDSRGHIFPSSAFQLATSSWYFDASDHRCPHDAWLEKLELFESSSGERRQERTLSLQLTLLGAYHDGHIELRYPEVYSYALNLTRGEQGHRDWRYDELRVSDNGHLIHEIEWWGPHSLGTWIIEASDLDFWWIPRIVG